MKTKEAAKILRNESDPNKLAIAIFEMGTDTYIKAVEFNKKAGLDWHRRDGEEVQRKLKALNRHKT